MASFILYKDAERVRETSILLDAEEARLRYDWNAFCQQGHPGGGVYEMEPTGDTGWPQHLLLRFEAITHIETAGPQ